jgi:hypothetical protein
MLHGDTSVGGSSGRIVCLLVLNRVTGSVIALCRRQAGRMLLAVSRQIFLAVAITVVVTDMVVPNTVLPMSACLCGIARKIAVASKRLAVSQVQLLCSVLCSCIYVFVFIINYFID